MTDVVAPTVSEEEKEVKKVYSELIVLWREAPTRPSIYDKEIWEQFQSLIDKLIKITGNSDYSEYRVKVSNGVNFGEYVNRDQYKSKLARLIARLHGEYWSHEPDPLNQSTSIASTIINNQNSQQQSQHQQQEQKIELEQMARNAQEMIQAEYGEEQAKKASDLIKQIISNPKNWAIISASIVALVHIGHLAFVAALPILGKILLETTSTHTA